MAYTTDEALLAVIRNTLSDMAANPLQSYRIGGKTFEYKDLDSLRAWEKDLLARIESVNTSGGVVYASFHRAR